MSATSSDIQATCTRYQSFRLRNRGKPFRQVFWYLTMSFALFGYGYLMFVVSPDRSYENVVTWNAAIEYRAKQIREEELEIRRVRRAKREAQSSSSSSKSALAEFGELISFLLTYFTCRMLLRSCLQNQHLPASMDETTQTPSGSTRRRSRSAMATADDPRGFLEAWSRRLERDNLDSQALQFLRAAEERARQVEAQQERARGATVDQIAVCPVRVVSTDDDILTLRNDGQVPQCDICLEPYRVNDAIRTIPCFHSFHAGCIDVWLMQRGACPVCLHPV